MIKNNRQFKIAKFQLRKFEETLNSFTQTIAQKDKYNTTVAKVQEDAIRSQLDELKAQVVEYEALQEGKVKQFHLNSFLDIPRVLIQARIASGLSQKELADRLNLKEQQIQRYEANDFSSASLSRLINIFNALDIEIKEEVNLKNATNSFKLLFPRLNKLGINKDFILERLIPGKISSQIISGKYKDNEKILISKFTEFIERIFNWDPGYIQSNEFLNFKYDFMPAFKKPRGIKEKFACAYTVYAHYLALILLSSMKSLYKKEIPTNPLEVRNNILKYGDLSFNNILKYVWDLGIPVLPLNDSGAFHGACWRSQGRNVIVLKQQTMISSRWGFDLLHELYHAGQKPEKNEYDVIELVENSKEWSESKDEQSASQFAGNVLLEGRAEELANLCVKEANHGIPRLKGAVLKVAKQENIEIDYLANYMAFRLSHQQVNWWGTANNLLTMKGNPWETARDMLLLRIDFTQINNSDKHLFQLALSE